MGGSLAHLHFFDVYKNLEKVDLGEPLEEASLAVSFDV